jgi:uncharacterized protein YecT (DUF1311 family)
MTPQRPLAPEFTMSMRTARQSIVAMILLATQTGLALAADQQAETDACMESAKTQSQLNICAQKDFEKATAAYSASYRQLSQSVGNKQRQLLRQVQTEWLQYRVKACEFEQNGVEGGSAAPMVLWQCQARMTRERTAELQRHLRCEEGDLSCVRPMKP